MIPAIDFDRLHQIKKQRDEIATQIVTLQRSSFDLEREARDIGKSVCSHLALIANVILRHAQTHCDMAHYDLRVDYHNPCWFYETKSLSMTYYVYNKHERHLQDFRPISYFNSVNIPFAWFELDEGMLAITIELAALGKHRDFYDWLKKYSNNKSGSTLVEPDKG